MARAKDYCSLGLAMARSNFFRIALVCIVSLLVLPRLISSAKHAKQRRKAHSSEIHLEPALWTYSVVAEYPHDPHAFTQGLQFDRACDNESKECYDVFWESTGLNGRSSIRQVNLSSGQVLRRRDLGQEHFGEGSARLGEALYMITWQTGRAFKFSLDLQKEEAFDTGLGDGWGLTTDGAHLIASESSPVIHWLDPATYKEVRRVTVTDRGKPIHWLNELEVVGDELWANVWQTECIARVNMSSGAVVGWIHMHGLREGIIQRGLVGSARELDVLNGIAYDAATKRIFVTGKLWPRVFEIVPKPYDLGQVPSWAAVKHLCWPSVSSFG